jgi:signal transduction histidine kinase
LIDEQSHGLANFIDNYRRISRIPQPVIIKFDAGEWTEQLRIVFGEKMKENSINCRIVKEPTVREITADKNLLNQVMINLMNNAMDAALEIENDRVIAVDISLFQQSRIRIRITNNGPVIPPEIQEKIFVPFFTTKANGSGIGLSICQEIVKLHHGSLGVISVPGGQTTFVIEL